MDSWIESDEPILYSAVTTGDIWQFGSFQRVIGKVWEGQEIRFPIFRFKANIRGRAPVTEKPKPSRNISGI